MPLHFGVGGPSSQSTLFYINTNSFLCLSISQFDKCWAEHIALHTFHADSVEVDIDTSHHLENPGLDRSVPRLPMEPCSAFPPENVYYCAMLNQM